MADLISRKELLEWLKVSEFENFSSDECYRYMMREIENAPDVNRWIPCSERLPETNTQVLCYCRMGDFRIMEYDEQESRWYEGIQDYRQTTVTHWMPLQEPPESEVQDDADM